MWGSRPSPPADLGRSSRSLLLRSLLLCARGGGLGRDLGRDLGCATWRADRGEEPLRLAELARGTRRSLHQTPRRRHAGAPERAPAARRPPPIACGAADWRRAPPPP